MTDLSISRSVSRAFAVLEYIRAARAPCTTPELEKALNYPYSSVRVILKSLRTLGYLGYDGERKTYFPTEKLMDLGSWVESAQLESEALARLLGCVRGRIGETTAIATPNFIFCNIVRVQLGSKPMSLRVLRGVGLTLSHSAAGRVLLSQMAQADVEGVVRHTQYWAGNTHSPPPPALADVQRAADAIRRCGSIVDYDRFSDGVGTIAYPLPTTLKATPLALFVSGPSVRIRHDEPMIRRVLELYLASYRAQVLR